ncbi:TetR/AcrR family transcriptional regulator [Streptomyces sp. NPDC050560]|uniref:TetR/AcrR family transcriptional regulator n=1 Tax=Streptomyces sp. NPDC050560 TaxID=3365630 RepID=UPI0037B2DCB2
MEAEGRAPRADARRNRAKVLRAAEEALAEEGMDASMRAVARRAGVGLGTIYRHFPTREALLQAIVAERAGALVAEAEALRAASDPGAAFFGFFTALVENATRQRAVADVLDRAGVDVKAGMTEVGAAMRSAIEALLRRAQEAGAVREGLGMPEVLALLGAVCLAAERQEWGAELRERTLGVVFDGFRPRP